MTKGNEAQLGGASIKKMLASIFKSKTPKNKSKKKTKSKTPKCSKTLKHTNSKKRKIPKHSKKTKHSKTKKHSKNKLKVKKGVMKGGNTPLSEAYNGIDGDFDYLPEGKDFGGKQPVWGPKTR